MNKLCIKLPPLTPDYSGVCSALYELGGMSIIHDASGCTGTYVGFDEPRWFDCQKPVFCSGLRELDAVLGNDDKLIQKIIKAAEDVNPEFITVLGSPVPMVIGTDFEGIATEIEERTGKVCFGFDTNGLHFYDEGVSRAYLKLAKTYVLDQVEGSPIGKNPKGINILGATPIDFSINSNVQDIKDYLQELGYEIVSCWSMGSSLEAIKKTATASVNLVVSVSGLAVAKYLKKKYDMPYVIGLPIGKTGEEQLALKLKDSLISAEEQQDIAESKEVVCTGRKVLVIGEQICANAIREVLRNEYDMQNVDVATFFTLNKEIATKNDIHIENECHIIKILREGGYDVVIGDPLIKQLLPKENHVYYINVPHAGVSSRLYWKQSAQLMGEKINDILGGINQNEA